MGPVPLYSTMRHGIVAGALILLGVGLCAALLALAGPAAVWEQLRRLGAWGFVAMLTVELVAVGFWVAAWGVLLRAQGAASPWSTITGAAVAGFAVSYITPVAYLGGEPVRAWLAGRSAGKPMTTVYATIMVDRLVGGLSLVTFAVLGGALALTGPYLPTVAKAQVGAGLFVVAVAVGLGVLSFARNYHWLSRILGFVSRRQPRRRVLAKAVTLTQQTEEDIHAAFNRYLPYTVLALACQLVSFLCTYVRPLLFFWFTQGTWFSVTELAVYFNLNAVLTTVLWMTPAGIGTAEGGRVGILHLVGIGADGAVAFSLVVRALELTVVALGLGYLVRRGLAHLLRGKLTGDG